MRFLVYTLPKHPAPPEMMQQLMEGTWEWASKHKENGTFEDIWAFAGLAGGGAIVNVASHDDLDALMAAFPMAPFSEIHIYPIVDLKGSLDRALAQVGSSG